MRYLPAVINDALTLVPERYRSRFQSLLSSATCAAPEIMGMWWNEGNRLIGEICLNDKGIPEYKWQVELLALWSTKSIEDICGQCQLNYNQMEDL